MRWFNDEAGLKAYRIICHGATTESGRRRRSNAILFLRQVVESYNKDYIIRLFTTTPRFYYLHLHSVILPPSGRRAMSRRWSKVPSTDSTALRRLALADIVS